MIDIEQLMGEIRTEIYNVYLIEKIHPRTLILREDVFNEISYNISPNTNFIKQALVIGTLFGCRVVVDPDEKYYYRVIV